MTAKYKLHCQNMLLIKFIRLYQQYDRAVRICPADTHRTVANCAVDSFDQFYLCEQRIAVYDINGGLYKFRVISGDRYKNLTEQRRNDLINRLRSLHSCLVRLGSDESVCM